MNDAGSSGSSGRPPAVSVPAEIGEGVGFGPPDSATAEIGDGSAKGGLVTAVSSPPGSTGYGGPSQQGVVGLLLEKCDEFAHNTPTAAAESALAEIRPARSSS